ncbi:hypothetical protein ABI59_17225 [Acidobacteria bacterium Mor1]|nr:hypothetical protein ABI59_17225 [Acidobacteria bacterium Mor1]
MSKDPPKPEELGDRFAELYTELRDLAGQIWRHNPSATLQRTALLNEAFLRLAGSKSVRPTDEKHFKRLAASAMRRVLIDAARRRQSLKRGEGWVAVTADSQPDPRLDDLDRLLAVDRALDKLAAQSERAAKLVELRFFAGLEVREAAELLDISVSQATRDWRAARAWLSVELEDPGIFDEER